MRREGLNWYTDEIVTKEMVEGKKSKAGGWTRAALAYLGVPWPPKKGWKSKILGLPRMPIQP